MSDIPFLERFGDALEAAATRQRPVRRWQTWLRPVLRPGPLGMAGTAVAAAFVIFTVIVPLVVQPPQPGLQTFDGAAQTAAPALGDEAMRSFGGTDADSLPPREEAFSSGERSAAPIPAPAVPQSAPSLQAPSSQARVWDDRILLELGADVVFVGRVVAQTDVPEPRLDSDAQASAVPFAVEVVKTIIGDLDATVTVAQHLAGADASAERAAAEQAAEHDDERLQPGSTYLFVAGERLEDGRYPLLNHPNARMPISADADATLAELEALASRHPRVVALEEMCESVDAC